MQPVNEVLQEIPQEIPLEESKPSGLEFDLLDLVLALTARKGTILLVTIVCMLLTYIVCTFRAPTYTGTAMILPPQQEQSGAAALVSQLGELSGLGGGGGLGPKSNNDLYIGILKSETIADAVIKQFDLMRVYHVRSLGAARGKLAKNSTFKSEKDDMISIAVEDHDPHRAAELANAYVAQLHSLNTHFAFTQASQRRLFYEQQLAQEKDRLADAEVALKQTEEQTGVLLPTGQLETIIRQITQVQAEITSHEIELDALRTSSTDQNPDVVRLNTELAGLREEESQLEAGETKHTAGDISMTSAAAPQLGLEYVRKERDVKYHQLLFDLLARQYAAARIDEAKEAPVIQVVDPALAPEGPSGPRRTLWTLVFGFAAFVLTCGWVLLVFVYHRLEKDERTGDRMILLKRDLKFSR